MKKLRFALAHFFGIFIFCPHFLWATSLQVTPASSSLVTGTEVKIILNLDSKPIQEPVVTFENDSGMRLAVSLVTINDTTMSGAFRLPLKGFSGVGTFKLGFKNEAGNIISAPLSGNVTFSLENGLASVYSGVLSGVIHWTKDSSPIRILGGTNFENTTLTIDPGVVVKFEKNGSNPILFPLYQALGTNAAPIILTTVRDDSVDGVDVLQNGPETANVGDWNGIKIINSNSAQEIHLSNVKILNSGGLTIESNSPVTLDNVVLQKNSLGLSLKSNAPTEILNSTFANNEREGIQFSGNGFVHLKNNSFISNYTPLAVLGTNSLFLEGNSFRQNVESQISCSVGAQIAGLENTVSDSPTTKSGIFLDHKNAGGHLKKSSIPYLLTYSFIPQTRLIVEGGVQIKSSRVDINCQNGCDFVGETSNPIFITSLTNDSIGGDSNSDGAATRPQPGDGASILFSNQSSSMKNVQLTYGRTLAIRAGALVSIENSVIDSMTDAGVFIFPNAQASIVGCTIQNHSIGIDALTNIGDDSSYQLEVRACIIQKNNTGISIKTNGPQKIIENQIVKNTENGINISGVGTIDLSNNDISANGNAMIFKDADTSLYGLNSLRTTVPNGINGILLTATSRKGILSQSVIPYVINSDGINFHVPQGLNIEAGVTIKTAGRILFETPVTFNGTETNPIIITSLSDSSIFPNVTSGNTNSKWPGMIFLSSATFSNTILKNSVAALYLLNQTTISITDSQFIGNDSLITQQNNASTTLIVEHSSFTQSGSGIVANLDEGHIHNCSFNSIGLALYNLSSKLFDATHNFWGRSEGPTSENYDSLGADFNPVSNPLNVRGVLRFNPWLGNTTLTSPVFTIKEGSSSSTTTLHLSLTQGDFVTKMRISNTPNFIKAPFENFKAQKIFQLPETNDGFQTIYVQFQASDGSVSEISSQQIYIGRQAPTISILLSQFAPLKAGTTQFQLISSEELSELPSLTWVSPDQVSTPVSIQTNDFLHFNGSFSIPENTVNGMAHFLFSGKDIDGNIGTAILKGSTFYIDTLAPAPPQIVAAESRPQGKIFLSWTRPQNEPGITFEVYESTKESDATPTRLSIPDEFVNSNSLLYLPDRDGRTNFWVKSVDMAGNKSSFSVTASADSDRVPPSNVKNLTLREGADAVVNLQWMENPLTDQVSSYFIYRANDGVSFNKVGQSTETTYQDLVPKENALHQYNYLVTAIDRAGNESVKANSVPIFIKANVFLISKLNLDAPLLGKTTHQLTLEFSREPNIQIPLSVFLTSADGSKTIPISSLNFSTALWQGQFSLPQNFPEGMAQIDVTDGQDDRGQILVSSHIIVTIDLTPPSIPVLSNINADINGTDVRIEWINSEPDLKTTIFRSTDSLASQVIIAKDLKETFFIDHPPASSLKAEYWIISADQANNESGKSQSKFVPLPLSAHLTAPKNGDRVAVGLASFQGTAQSGTELLIYSSTNGVIGRTFVRPDGNFNSSVYIPKEGPYEFSFVTLNSLGQFSINRGTVDVIADNLPPASTELSALPGDTITTLSWNASIDKDVVGYWIFRDGNSIPLNRSIVPSNGILKFTDVGLTNGRTYRYQISAQDSGNQIGPKSNSVQSIPQGSSKWGSTK